MSIKKEVFYMEKKSKNQISTFLMVVGVIFILVAGTIFVTTAWKHLPLIAKQAALLCISIGLFAGAGKVSESGRLQKSEVTLFYLGVAFIGFFTVSFMGQNDGYVPDRILESESLSLMWSCIVMMVPTLFRFWKRRNGLDFFVTVMLNNGVIVWSMCTFELCAENFLLMLACVMLLFAVGDYYKEKWMQQKKGLEAVFSICYLLHGIVYVSFMWIEVFEKERFFCLTVVLVAVTLLTYMKRKAVAYRILNSLAIIWCVFTGADLLNSLLPEAVKMSDWGVIFVSYVVILAINVYTMRKELLVFSIGFGIVIPYSQLISYGGYHILFSYVSHTVTTYIPFTAVMMIGLSLIVKRQMDSGKITWDDGGKRMIKAILVQSLTVFILLQASLMEGFITMGFHWNTMVIFLTGAVLKKKSDVGKETLETFALAAGQLAVFNQPYFEIPANYKVEWICFILGIGIVLLHYIWYDKAKGIKVVNFVMTCVLLICLLLNDIAQGGLGNVLILGIAGVIILIVAAVFNQRQYVIAASVTLILLILYITRNFWLSIAWWVYLFVAGVVLVVLAIKKEKEM